MIVEDAYHIYLDTKDHDWDKAFSDLISSVDDAEAAYNVCYDKEVEHFEPEVGVDIASCLKDIDYARKEITTIVKTFKSMTIDEAINKAEDLFVIVGFI